MAELSDLFTSALERTLDVAEAKARAKIDNAPPAPAPKQETAAPAIPKVSPMLLYGGLAVAAVALFFVLKR